jgi:hypothetical protein
MGLSLCYPTEHRDPHFLCPAGCSLVRSEHSSGEALAGKCFTVDEFYHQQSPLYGIIAMSKSPLKRS